MTKKNIEIAISKLIAVLAIVLGSRLMDAYRNKVLPFGLESSTELLGMWMCIGWFVAIIVQVYGVMLMFRRTTSRCIRKLR